MRRRRAAEGEPLTMSVVRISDGPLRGVLLETRRRGPVARLRAATRALLRRRRVGQVAPLPPA